jgi:hypothetical protein
MAKNLESGEKKFNPRRGIYCATFEIYKRVVEFAKQQNAAAGFTRGGHRGTTAKNLGGKN